VEGEAGATSSRGAGGAVARQVSPAGDAAARRGDRFVFLGRAPEGRVRGGSGRVVDGGWVEARRTLTALRLSWRYFSARTAGGDHVRWKWGTSHHSSACVRFKKEKKIISTC